MRSPAFYVARLPWQRRDALAPRSGVALAAPSVGRATEQRSFSVGPQVMASLRRASPRLRKYFKENYIPQVCEALLCGLLVTCPEDPLRYLEEMIIGIMENGLETLLWDMCIDPLMKPKIRRLSETYLEQLFGLDDQLVTPELMIKACNFYNGRLLKTHFYTWKEIAIPLTNEDEVLAEKMEAAIVYDNFRLKKHVLHHWHSYVKNRKEQLRDALLRIQKMFHCYKMIITLNKWRDRARHKFRKREDELIDFSAVRNIITDKYIVSILQRWRLNVLRLNFRGCVLRLKTLRSVSLCKNLQELNVSDCPTLTDESMRYISESCPGVLYLNLSNTVITNRTMRLLPRYFYNLQNLSLAYCRKFTDKGLQYLNLGNGCHKLIYLDLSGCTQISVQGFRNIANSCSGIMHLTINDMPTLTDNCVKALVEKCRRISSVVFIGAPHISDSTFKALSACDIKKIRFEGNKRITDACFKLIDKSYPNIRHIYMVDCKGITDGSLKSLSPLKHLTVLNLANCVRCYNLTYLSLRNCEHLTDLGVEFIANIFSLVSVDLSGTDISNEGLMTLSRHRKLKELSVSECDKITDFGIQITDSAMEMLSAKCHYLHVLDVSGCILLTDQMLENLEMGCRQLRILKMQYCRLISK
ncbi:hypothetical protein G4228_011935 [Cervus hanglu yarkandensis]|nr:hypothetical protein G4228_011935 [Cervus hanglu yarkandensis]